MKTIVVGVLLASAAVFACVSYLSVGNGPPTELVKKQYEPAVIDHAVYVVTTPTKYVAHQIVPVSQGKVIVLIAPIPTANSPPAVNVNDNARIRAADI